VVKAYPTFPTAATIVPSHSASSVSSCSTRIRNTGTVASSHIDVWCVARRRYKATRPFHRTNGDNKPSVVDAEHGGRMIPDPRLETLDLHHVLIALVGEPLR
jgi:hypothetical protein